MHMMRDSLKKVRVMLLGNRRRQLFKYVHEFRIINAYTLDLPYYTFFVTLSSKMISSANWISISELQTNYS